jgi:hypothetical protein
MDARLVRSGSVVLVDGSPKSEKGPPVPDIPQ